MRQSFNYIPLFISSHTISAFINTEIKKINIFNKFYNYFYLLLFDLSLQKVRKSRQKKTDF